MKRLWFLVLLLFIGFVVPALWFPLFGRADQLPLADVRTFAPTLGAGLLYAFLICALFATYWIAYRLISGWRQGGSQLPPWWSFFAVTVLFGVPLILSYPVNAVDQFRYFFEGRMMVAHGANPFIVAPETLTHDPLLPFAAILLHKTSPYGPLWELVCASLYWLSGGNIIAGLILFKTLGLACHLAAGFVIWQLLAGHNANIRTAQLLLWLWNPALLFMFVMDAHNDSLMLLLLLMGYQKIVQQRPVIGLLLLTCAVLVKPIALLPIPIFALMAWQQMEGWKGRIRLVSLATLGAAIIATLAFLPFGSPWPLLERLQNEAQSGASFSPVQFILAFGEMAGVEIPLPLVARWASLLFVFLALLLYWLSLRGRNPLRGAADIFAVYMVTALRFRIWYPTWLFPWVVLDTTSRFRLYAACWLLLLSQLSVIHYGHVRMQLLNESIALAHLIAVPIVFGVPLIMAFLASKVRWAGIARGC